MFFIYLRKLLPHTNKSVGHHSDIIPLQFYDRKANKLKFVNYEIERECHAGIETVIIRRICLKRNHILTN